MGPEAGPKCPKIRIFKKFMAHFRVQNQVPRAQKSNFSKNENKTPPEIHPSYKCAKFQTDLAIYTFPRADTQIHCQVESC